MIFEIVEVVAEIDGYYVHSEPIESYEREIDAERRFKEIQEADPTSVYAVKCPVNFK